MCTRCGTEFDARRPKDYCMADDCVTGAIAERRGLMTIVSIPKAGDRLVFKDDVVATAAPGRHHAPV